MTSGELFQPDRFDRGRVNSERLASLGRRLTTLLVGSLAVLAMASPRASAEPVSTCQATVAYVRSAWAKVIAEAGNPPIICEPAGAAPAATIDGTPISGSNFVTGGDWDGTTIRVYTQRDNTAYDAYDIGHELGHAYAQRVEVSYKAYGAVRGEPLPALTPDAVQTWGPQISEDYAETFVYSLGAYQDFGGPPPYAFQNSAGVPTQEQLKTLRVDGLLPAFPGTELEVQADRASEKILMGQMFHELFG